jgi:exportin-1
LVQIREFTGEDDSDLFLEERDTALKAAQDEKRKITTAVPGMLNPHEVAEEMQEM